MRALAVFLGLSALSTIFVAQVTNASCAVELNQQIDRVAKVYKVGSTLRAASQLSLRLAIELADEKTVGGHVISLRPISHASLKQMTNNAIETKILEQNILRIFLNQSSYGAYRKERSEVGTVELKTTSITSEPDENRMQLADVRPGTIFATENGIMIVTNALYKPVQSAFYRKRAVRIEKSYRVLQFPLVAHRSEIREGSIAIFEHRLDYGGERFWLNEQDFDIDQFPQIGDVEFTHVGRNVQVTRWMDRVKPAKVSASSVVQTISNFNKSVEP